MTGSEHDDPGTGRPSRRRVLSSVGALGATAVAGCLGDGLGSDGDGASGGATETEASVEDSTGGSATETEAADGDGVDGGTTETEGFDGPEATPVSNDGWRSVELTDVRTGETFTVGGFDGPVVLQSFAVWCPKCTRQERAMSGVEGPTRVSLNVDPNEDAEKVRSHAADNGFDWRYAVAPAEMTESLVDAFGTTITNPPSTPVVVDCGGDRASFLSGSVTAADRLERAARQC